MGRIRLKDSVVVITGASSGIGRAAAMAMARRGATVGLIARREKALQELAETCRKMGGQAMPLPADVSDEAAVRDAARRVIEEYGKIDVWVNNAAVTMFGRTEEVPYASFRRVIDTNLFGYLNCARAVIPYFREQGSGVLINVSSQAGKIGQPYTSAYVASKFAINGLSECLRMELMDAPDIHVCAVIAASIDTPLFHHGANYTGRAIKPLDPVYAAEKVSAAILGLVARPRREVYVGNAGRVLSALRTLAPAAAEKAMALQVETGHFQERPAAASDGNLFTPIEEWNTISGGWKHTGRAEPIVGAGIGAMALVAAGAIGYAAYRLTR